MIADRGCAERGCACYDPRIDKDGVTMIEATKADDIQVGGNHYKDMDPQPWAVMQALLTPEEFRGYLKGNMIKYAMRQGKKDSPDAGKYHHYDQKLSEITGDDTWT